MGNDNKDKKRDTPPSQTDTSPMEVRQQQQMSEIRIKKY